MPKKQSLAMAKIVNAGYSASKNRTWVRVEEVVTKADEFGNRLTVKSGFLTYEGNVLDKTVKDADISVTFSATALGVNEKGFPIWLCH
jgi:hypothetical protein